MNIIKSSAENYIPRADAAKAFRKLCWPRLKSRGYWKV